MVRLVLVAWLLSGLAALAEDGSAAFPERQATVQDLRLLDGPQALVKQELARMGLHQAVGHTCRAFVTLDSIRPIETPLPTPDGLTVTLPYASFMIWGSDRPFAEAILYHVFGTTDAAYKQPRSVEAGGALKAQAAMIALAPRAPYPSRQAIAAMRPVLEAGPFEAEGETKGARHLVVRPYSFPTQSDDPASVLPHKQLRTLQVTCLSDPNRASNCLCAGTD